MAWCRPATSFTGADLSAIAGVSLKVLATWRRAGVLPPAPPVRRGARYDREVARRACAIGKAGLQAAKLRRFAEMVPLILDEAPPPVRASPPPVRAEPAPAPATPAEPMVGAAPSGAGAAPVIGGDGGLPGAAWTRVELLPGLEIHVAAGASPVIHELAREVARRFGVVSR